MSLNASNVEDAALEWLFLTAAWSLSASQGFWLFLHVQMCINPVQMFASGKLHEFLQEEAME